MRIFIASVAYILFITLTGFYVEAEKGVILPQGFIVQISNTTCGLVDSKWIPGVLQKNGSFLPTASKINSLSKKLKNKNLSSTKKAKLKKQRGSLKKLLKSSAPICSSYTASANPTAAPIPPVIATPHPDATVVAWEQTAFENKSNTGGEYFYFCPANPPGSLRSIWGNDVYTADSAICVAAAHLGLITRTSGGNVKIRIKTGQQFYAGSFRNSIQSNFFGSYDASFVFVDLNSGTEIITNSIPVLTFSQSAQPVHTYLGQQFTFFCPGATFSDIDSIWGTDLYTYDSSICTAAVHAGRISLANGGIVTIRIDPGAASYSGSSRNGITSSSYGPWSGSFSFVG